MSTWRGKQRNTVAFSTTLAGMRVSKIRLTLVRQTGWDGARRIVGSDPRAETAWGLSLGSECLQARAKKSKSQTIVWKLEVNSC
jgi:hypothetical protein